MHNTKIFDMENLIKGNTMVGIYPKYDDTQLEVLEILQWGMHIHSSTLPRAQYSKQERVTTEGRLTILQIDSDHIRKIMN